MRSEFPVANDLLAEVITLTRTHSLFPSFAARISLHHGHFAHAIGNTQRALKCYDVAAHLAGEGTWIWASAQAGRIGLRLGLQNKNEPTAPLDQLFQQVCKDAGGTLECVHRVLEACCTTEIVKSK